MSVSSDIICRVKRMQKGKPFASSVFLKLGSHSAVNSALARLVKRGMLERVVRGIYVRPKESEFFGSARPSPAAVAMAIAKSRGETLQVHGAEAVRKLQLSTQVPMQEHYYTSGATRKIRVGNAVVHLRHARPQLLQCAGTRVGVAISALFYLGEKQLNINAAKRVLSQLNSCEIKRLQRCAMPSWMRARIDEAARLAE